jgi:hypothetical protein
MHLRILGFGLPVDGDVGVGVFPEGEEVFARVSRNRSRGSFRRGAGRNLEALLEEANFDLFDFHRPSIM